MKHSEKVVEITEQQGGFSFPISFPLTIPRREVVWSVVDNGDKENQKINYRKYLVGKNVIETIEEFIKETFVLQEETEDYNKRWKSTHHKALVFRGQSSKEYELLPAIGRGRKFFCDISILNQERNLIEMAKYKLPHIFRADLLPLMIV